MERHSLRLHGTLVVASAVLHPYRVELVARWTSPTYAFALRQIRAKVTKERENAVKQMGLQEAPCNERGAKSKNLRRRDNVRAASRLIGARIKKIKSQGSGAQD